LCHGPKKYIGRIVDAHVQMFVSRPSTKHTSPLMKNEHPELDMSDLLDNDGIAQYQSLIGILQWTITLGRFDVGTAFNDNVRIQNRIKRRAPCLLEENLWLSSPILRWMHMSEDEEAGLLWVAGL
jgi:hypothetical protein